MTSRGEAVKQQSFTRIAWNYATIIGITLFLGQLASRWSFKRPPAWASEFAATSIIGSDYCRADAWNSFREDAWKP